MEKPPQPRKRPDGADRAERLKAALKENLRKRKAQKRARGEATAGQASPDDKGPAAT